MEIHGLIDKEFKIIVLRVLGSYKKDNLMISGK